MIVDGKGRYINLGDWIRYNTYAVFDGADLQLKSSKAESGDERIERHFQSNRLRAKDQSVRTIRLPRVVQHRAYRPYRQ